MAQSCCGGSRWLWRRSSDKSREQEKNTQDILCQQLINTKPYLYHLRKGIPCCHRTVQSQENTPWKRRFHHQHLTYKGEWRGHHPIGWTNEQWTVRAQAENAPWLLNWYQINQSINQSISQSVSQSYFLSNEQLFQGPDVMKMLPWM